MKRYILLTAVTLLFFLTNCGDKKIEESNEPASKLDIVELSEEIESSILDAYMELKDALIDSDPEKAVSMAEELSRVVKVEETDMKELSELIDKLAGSEDLEEQRQYFSSISENLYTLIKNQENNAVTIYKQYCPMAFENEGAFWLSNKSKVINPYFGDKMLNCGRVQEIIVASN